MLQLNNLTKDYPTPRGRLPILDHVTLAFQRGDAVAMMGPSGSGKSTLLYLLGALDAPTAGTVTLDGQNPFELDESRLAAFRNEKIGFVFQDHCLLPQCSVLENVLTPTLVARNGKTDPVARAKSLLAKVGLSERLDHRPAELSGGEKQRVAIARTVLKAPPILVLDEATSALDSHTEHEIQEALERVSRGRTSLVIAHRLSTIVGADEIIVLDQGRIAERGTHARLLAAGGLYASMWNRQREAEAAREKLAQIDDDNEAANRAPPPVDDPLNDPPKGPAPGKDPLSKDPLATAAE
jgi:ATP-binding cassette, subfamily B, heavy metal transporter